MNYFDVLVERLSNSRELEGFAFKKGTSSFVQKFDGGRREVALPHAHSIVCPSYRIRFDIVEKWFERFCVRSIRDQRSSCTIFFNNQMLGLEPFFFFETTEACENWEKLYRLERSVKEGASKFFSMFNEFEGVYHYLIEPLISDPEKLKIYNGRGAEWLFNYLTICRIVAPENYSKLKEILLDYEAKWTTGERTNPNFMFYHDRLDEILSYMESLDFSKMMNKSK